MKPKVSDLKPSPQLVDQLIADVDATIDRHDYVLDRRGLVRLAALAGRSEADLSQDERLERLILIRLVERGLFAEGGISS